MQAPNADPMKMPKVNAIMSPPFKGGDESPHGPHCSPVQTRRQIVRLHRVRDARQLLRGLPEAPLELRVVGPLAGLDQDGVTHEFADAARTIVLAADRARV